MSTNVFQRLKSLLPDPPLLAGTVTSTDNGVHKITLPGGGIITARGIATVGSTVFVRDGLVEGQAPSLTIVVIDV